MPEELYTDVSSASITLGFEQSGVGAKANTLEAKVQENLSASDFEVAGDFDDAAATTLGDLANHTDNTAPLQLMLDEAERRHGAICTVYPTASGANFLLLAQIRIPSNTTLKLSDGVKLWRGWNNTGSNKKDATVINKNHLEIGDFIVDPGPYNWRAATIDKNVYVLGPGGFDVATVIRNDTMANNKYAGPHVSFVGVIGCGVNSTNSMRASRDWAFNFIGDNGIFNDNTLLGGEIVFEDGFHLYGGKNWRISGNYIESGDDAYAFGGNYNLAVSNIVGSANVGKSLNGHLLRILQFREGSTSGFPNTEYVENFDFSVVGGGGLERNGVVRIDTNTNAPHLVRNLRLNINGTMGDAAAHDKVNAYGLMIFGGKNITVNGTISNPVRSGLFLRNGADEITLNLKVEAPQQIGFDCADIESCGEVTVNGVLYCNDRAGIRCASTDELTIGAMVKDIPTNYGICRFFGINSLVARGAVGKVAASTSNTYGYRTETGSAVAMNLTNDDTSAMTNRLSLITVPTSFFSHNGKGTKRTRTVTSAAISWQGESHIAAATPASADLSSVTNVPDGHVLRISTDNVSPGTNVVTLVAGTGANNLNIGSNQALDTSGKGALVVFQGGTFQKLAVY